MTNHKERDDDEQTNPDRTSHKKERRLEHAKKRHDEIKTEHDQYENKTEKLTYHAGHSLGYWSARVELLDEQIQELLELEAAL